MKEMTEEYRQEMLKAIRERHSVRHYLETPIDVDTILLLNKKIKELNREGRLNMQLVTEEPKGFSGFFAYGQFSGVRNYVVVAGEKDDTLDERIGYYGEQLVLYAQLLVLNTCWAGLSYRKVKGTYQLASGEKIGCYIAIGYGKTQGTSHKIKKPQDVSNVSAETPGWFLDGVEAALLAPTAINQQKFSFEYEAPASPDAKARVAARPGFSVVGYTRMDLGIARLHFEIGANPANFTWLPD